MPLADPDTLPPLSRLARVITTPPRFPNDPVALDNGQRAALARLSPDAMRADQVGALARALLAAGIDPDGWPAGLWRRWATIAHGIALAGHNGAGALGTQFADANVSEARVTKLLTSRGDAFDQLLPRVLRLMASRGVAPNWNELGALVLAEGRDEPKAEALRLQIAGRFFSALSRAA